MPKHVQTPSVSDFQWPIGHVVACMVAYPYLVKNIGIISMENAQKHSGKEQKKLMLSYVI